MGLFSFFKRKKKEDVEPQIENAAQESAEDLNVVDVETPVKAEEVQPVKKENKAASAKKSVKNSSAEAENEAKKAPKAKKEDKAPTEDAVEAPVEEETDTPSLAPDKITGRFEIKKAKDGRFVFNLYASNHVIVATSQVYSSSTSAVNGIQSVINNAHKAPIEDQSLKSYETYGFPKWEIYVDKGNQYRFRLYAANGSCICHSQGYTTKASCKNGIDSIIRSSRNAEIDKSYLKKEEK